MLSTFWVKGNVIFLVNKYRFMTILDGPFCFLLLLVRRDLVSSAVYDLLAAWLWYAPCRTECPALLHLVLNAAGWNSHLLWLMLTVSSTESAFLPCVYWPRGSGEITLNSVLKLCKPWSENRCGKLIANFLWGCGLNWFILLTMFLIDLSLTSLIKSSLLSPAK